MAALYSIDTGALINPWHKFYQPDMFGSIWKEHIPRLLAAGTLVASRQVLIEIERQEDELCEWCRGYKDHFPEVDDSTAAQVTKLMDTYEKLTTGGRNEADPFVIALAMSRNPVLTVVAEEGGGKPNSKKQNIPYICQEQKVRCITFNAFLRETGWREGGQC
jgi:uncharacterized protein DUF4411